MDAQQLLLGDIGAGGLADLQAWPELGLPLGAQRSQQVAQTRRLLWVLAAGVVSNADVGRVEVQWPRLRGGQPQEGERGRADEEQ